MFDSTLDVQVLRCVGIKEDRFFLTRKRTFISLDVVFRKQEKIIIGNTQKNHEQIVYSLLSTAPE